MHFVELSKIGLEPEGSALKLWMHFLLARDEEELEELAMSDPNIRRATEALAALSRDPEAQELARQREMAQINLKIIKQFEREGGEAKGRAEGEAKGRAEGRVEGEAKGRAEGLLWGARLLERLLVAKFGELSNEVKSRLQAASADDIERWAERVLNAERIEAVFTE